jgi:predicted ATPase
MSICAGENCAPGLPVAEQTFGLAERFGDPHFLIQPHFVMGQFTYYLGNLAAARRHFEKGLALYVPERGRTEAARYGYNFYTACHSWLGIVLRFQGFPDEALRHAEEAIAAARADAHPLSEAWALGSAAQVHQSRGDVMLCLEWAEAGLALATEQVLPFYVASAMVLGGWAVIRRGQPEEGLARLRAGIDAYRPTGRKVSEPRCLALLAETYLATGRIEEALSAVREALADVEETEARCYDAELNRLEGELRLASKEPDEKGAEASFRKALVIVRGQGARSVELKAATSLARLLACQGKHGEPRELLVPIYDWFTEGFGTADLKEAQALLGALD